MLNSPTEYLDLYDDFDLDEKYQRRLAAYALINFYGDILSQAGIEHLGFPGQVDKNIGPKWNTAKTRLQTLDIDIPEKYSAVINRLGNHRNEIAHNHTLNPNRQLLEEARKLAEEWVDWFDEAIEMYELEKGERSAKETMARIARATLDNVYEDPYIFRKEELVSTQQDINKEEKQLRKTIDDAMENTEGITEKLIFALSDAKELEQQKREIDLQRSHRPKQEDEWKKKQKQLEGLREVRDSLEELRDVLSPEEPDNQ